MYISVHTYIFFSNFDCGLSYSRQEEYGVFTSEITSCVLLKVSLLACGFSAFLVTPAGRGFMLMNLPEGTQTLQLFLVMMSDSGRCSRQVLGAGIQQSPFF